MSVAALPHSKLMYAIELLGTRVAPLVRAALASETAVVAFAKECLCSRLKNELALELEYLPRTSEYRSPRQRCWKIPDMDGRGDMTGAHSVNGCKWKTHRTGGPIKSRVLEPTLLSR